VRSHIIESTRAPPTHQPPGDLPVEFPNKMVLSVNLKTATALAVKISEAFLLRADEVIE
jgi:putative ABC transport system substrate-binding protein